MKVTPPRSAAVRLLALSAAAAPGSFVAVVDAYPEGAGTCAVGPDGPAFPAVRNPHVDNGMGGLEVGLFSVEVGGTALTANSSDPVDVNLDASGAPTVRILADASNPLKGFLVTLQEDGKDYSSSLSAAGDDSQILTSEGLGSNGQPGVCAADVGGATHTDADDKAEVTLQLEAANIPAGEADLTVTVMERRRVWYFNSFRVNFLSSSGGNATDPPPPGNDTVTDAPTPAPGNDTDAGANATDAPTPAPGNGTDANATDAPTPMPVMNTSAPTAMPVTDSPTAMPVTDSPTTMPVTEEPTLMPATDFPTAAPSSGPSAGPTDMPVTDEPTTAKPTASPTEAPSMEPSEGLPSAATTVAAVGSFFATAFAGMALAWILAY